MRSFLVLVVSTAALFPLGASAQLIRTAPLQVSPKVTAPKPPQPQQPVGVQRRPAGQSVPPALTLTHWPPASNPDPGTISGYVYWDTRVVHNSAKSCAGLAVTVMLGDGALRREQFQPLGTYTHFIYLDNSALQAVNGTVPRWMAVCAYVVKLPDYFTEVSTLRKPLITR